MKKNNVRNTLQNREKSIGIRRFKLKEEFKKLSNEELESISGGGKSVNLISVVTIQAAPLHVMYTTRTATTLEIGATVPPGVVLTNVWGKGSTLMVPLTENRHKLKNINENVCSQAPGYLLLSKKFVREA